MNKGRSAGRRGRTEEQNKDVLLFLELHGALNALGTTDHIRDMELLIDQGEGRIIRAHALNRSLQSQEASI